MIRATCCCRATVKIDTGYRDDDVLQFHYWMGQHEECLVISRQRGMNALSKTNLGRFVGQCPECDALEGKLHTRNCKYGMNQDKEYVAHPGKMPNY